MKVICIYWDDLTPDAQARIQNECPEFCDNIIEPLATIEVSDDKSEEK